MIAIKAGWDCANDGASGRSIPTTNVTIRNVTQHFGGGCISLGSEMSGGLAHIHVSNVRCHRGSYGIQVLCTGRMRMRRPQLDSICSLSLSLSLSQGY